MEFDSVARTHVGCRREINEDAFLSRPDLGLWAVSDGMGGHEAGEIASALVIEALAGAAPSGELAARVAVARGCLEDANARLVAMGRQGAERRTIGATVVTLLASASAIACLWAGDSRLYRARGGDLRQLSRDHSLVQELVDAGDIDAADARNHPYGHIVTRAVGSVRQLVIDQTEEDLRAGDAFLLASDGLTRLVSEAELLAALMSPDLEQTADALIETCLARDAPDNLTLILLRAR